MKTKLNLVLCWHMHQPYYRDGLDGDFFLPWVYLHAIKDYDDMAAHLERHPQMRVVVNFVPTLLLQLEEYATQMDAFLSDGRPLGDNMLNWLAGATRIPQNASERKTLIRNCMRLYRPRMVDPYPKFRAILSLFDNLAEDHLTPAQETLLEYLDDQYFNDLLTWYHLSWCSHRLKQTPTIRQLMLKGNRFSLADRRCLIQAMHQTISSIVPRFRTLAELGQIELSMTPWGHPIVPLLNDFTNMRDAQPDAPGPSYPIYPDGESRSRWHLEHGLSVFQKFFMCRPRGVWLSEGGVSEDALRLLDEFGIEWTASGEAVWHHSQSSNSHCNPTDIQCRKALFMPYQLKDCETRIFFRDDGLSDLIGFEYAKWHADDAVGNFLKNLTNIATGLGDEASQHTVAVILDGENAWEYYPENGFFFLNALYLALSESDHISPSTFSDCLQHKQGQLERLAAGSWVYGSFSTWIGEKHKNRAWDYLLEAKLAYDHAMTNDHLSFAERQDATEILAICEGSDWFWWFGDYNPGGSVRDFDCLYRRQLKQLYRTLKIAPPAELDTPISLGGGHAENAGTMRRN